MTPIISYKDKNFTSQLETLAKNSSTIDQKQLTAVEQIIAAVKKDGDQALIKICNQFDQTQFKKGDDLLVDQKTINKAKKSLDKNLILALETSFKRIADYHEKQIPKDFFYRDDLGVGLGNRWQAINNIGIYVPGGTALYPSSVLMNAVPAIVAKCPSIVMTTPSHQGKINEVVLAAAEICGIKTIYKVGGAAAIAALALGTKTIKPVDKIVGPGNSFVALAKKQLFGEVGIDMIAGPTDILVISDNKTDPNWVAADLLSQAEHGVDSRSILITDDANFALLVNQAITKLTKTLSRVAIIKKSLKNSALIVVKNLQQDAAKIANKIAPEHLEIMTDEPDSIASQIKNAGAIFLGRYTPEAIGDYMAGPSHTLPTLGTARFASGLSVFDFLKRISIINCPKNSFKKLQSHTAFLAESEGFSAHQLSIIIRK